MTPSLITQGIALGRTVKLNLYINTWFFYKKVSNIPVQGSIEAKTKLKTIKKRVKTTKNNDKKSRKEKENIENKKSWISKAN